MKKNGRRRPKKSQTRILKVWEAPSFYAHFSKPAHLVRPLTPSDASTRAAAPWDIC